MIEKVRYSDDELEEFREIINGKLVWHDVTTIR